MKIDLLTKQLFTDDGKFLKELACPLKIKNSQLKVVSEKTFSCSGCQSTILDTARFSDGELVKLLQEDPKQCLKVNLNQPNLSII